MTPHLRKEVMRFDRYREQFLFLRENNIVTPEDIAAFQSRTEAALTGLIKQRTILNVRKKKRKKLYDALADAEALSQAKALYEDGLSDMEVEFTQYMEAVSVLEQCGIPLDQLMAEKAEAYEQLAQVNRDIRTERKNLALCQEIQSETSRMAKDIQKVEGERDVHNQRHSR